MHGICKKGTIVCSKHDQIGFAEGKVAFDSLHNVRAIAGCLPVLEYLVKLFAPGRRSQAIRKPQYLPDAHFQQALLGLGSGAGEESGANKCCALSRGRSGSGPNDSAVGMLSVLQR